FRIIHGPRTRLIASADRLAAAVRNVMYPVTFRAETSERNGYRRWYNIRQTPPSTDPRLDPSERPETPSPAQGHPIARAEQPRWRLRHSFRSGARVSREGRPRRRLSQALRLL